MSNIIGNLNGLASSFETGLDSFTQRTDSLKDKMAQLSNMSSEDQNSALIELQFEMGQYNALVELTSNIGKSITDTAKSLAQKV